MKYKKIVITTAILFIMIISSFLYIGYLVKNNKDLAGQYLDFCNFNGYNQTFIKMVNNQTTNIICYQNTTKYKMYNISEFKEYLDMKQKSK